MKPEQTSHRLPSGICSGRPAGRLFNRSRINTVVVCALTSNLKRAGAPGNVFLEIGEGGLPRQSVVNVSQIFTVDKGDLREKVGSLPRQRVREILAGVSLVIEPKDLEG